MIFITLDIYRIPLTNNIDYLAFGKLDAVEFDEYQPALYWINHFHNNKSFV